MCAIYQRNVIPLRDAASAVPEPRPTNAYLPTSLRSFAAILSLPLRAFASLREIFRLCVLCYLLCKSISLFSQCPQVWIG
jgi:hypothetical protein